ncbi:MAG TPA: allantoinase AllB [Thermoanaerobaculia bacterium]|nr:allantoinase AllB [Thermoanaerobaculia bacterium]
MILRSRRVVTPSGVRPASIHVRGEKIERIDDAPAEVDYGDLVIMPGVVDSHVHVNEPGRTEWEGFETATRAAAAGGVTTIVDMPLNSIPPTTSVAALLKKAEAMEGKCRVDVGLWGGAVPGNARALQPMLREGALGFKCFLVDSGVPEFGHLDADGLAEALDALRGTGAPLLVHAELADRLGSAHGRSYRAWLDSRPPEAEDAAIDLVLREVKRSGARAHIVHLSSSGGLDRLRRARDARLPLTAETTPHYLHFEAESIPDGATEFKCAPPIRGHANREALWRGIGEELLAAIVSDHSPCTPELKRLAEGDIEHAWGGIASLQFGLPVVWSHGRVTLEQLALLMCSGPASIAGIDSRKGAIAPGFDADFVVWSPEERFRVTPDLVQHRHKRTPYLGEELCGVVTATFVRGRKVWEDGREVGTAFGRWIREK